MRKSNHGRLHAHTHAQPHLPICIALHCFSQAMTRSLLCDSAVWYVRTLHEEEPTRSAKMSSSTAFFEQLQQTIAMSGKADVKEKKPKAGEKTAGSFKL